MPVRGRPQRNPGPSNQGSVTGLRSESGQARVTLTMQVINRAERVVFLVTGADKTEKVRLITGGKQNAKLFPSTYVNPSSGQLYWLFDQAANPKP